MGHELSFERLITSYGKALHVKLKLGIDAFEKTTYFVVSAKEVFSEDEQATNLLSSSPDANKKSVSSRRSPTASHSRVDDQNFYERRISERQFFSVGLMLIKHSAVDIWNRPFRFFVQRCIFPYLKVKIGIWFFWVFWPICDLLFVLLWFWRVF